MNIQKQKEKIIQLPWKWKWLKTITGVFTFIIAIAAVTFFVILGILFFPIYVVKGYIKNRIEKRKNF
jgi:type IV secretory pathway component VirB8